MRFCQKAYIANNPIDYLTSPRRGLETIKTKKSAFSTMAAKLLIRFRCVILQLACRLRSELMSFCVEVKDFLPILVRHLPVDITIHFLLQSLLIKVFSMPRRILFQIRQIWSFPLHYKLQENTKSSRKIDVKLENQVYYPLAESKIIQFQTIEKQRPVSLMIIFKTIAAILERLSVSVKTLFSQLDPSL